ncbi:MAG: hypothetical protein H6810_02750 [Phycisphaeraceae bacterium]|nr:MAG: hypothetical protein H6810_02750 [Phycisphaeraceae bacterium]
MPRPLDDAPNEFLDQARVRLRAEYEANRYEEQGRRLARRIVVAFVLVVITAVIFFIIVPSLNVHLPVFVPVLCFAVIVLGSVLSHTGDAPPQRPPRKRDDCGCAVGCCTGPRPLKMFRDKD